MKICPVCNQTYTDNNLNYCLNDGGVLQKSQDDAPPTVMLNQGRTTRENWQNFDTSAPWQNQPLQTHQSSPMQTNSAFSPVSVQSSPNQTLPTVSLVLGIFGILFTCCWGGIPFGAAALVTGYLGLKNFNESPQQYGGRGLAIAGMVLGVIGLLISIGIFLFSILAQF